MILQMNFCDNHMHDPIWFNSDIRLKSKKFFYYPSWYERGIHCIHDIVIGNRVMEFFELVLQYDISIKDLRKYNFLVKALPFDWLHQNNTQDPFDLIVDNLLRTDKVPRFAYSILREKQSPAIREEQWFDYFDLQEDIDWHKIHTNIFHCTIETQLRAFYFKVFHHAVATNEFLHKIGRTDDPNCTFCHQFPDSLAHFLCECPSVQNMWDDIINLINTKTNSNFHVTMFEKMFGIIDNSPHTQFINFIFLCTKFFIYRCKFQNQALAFPALLAFIKNKIRSEYITANKKNKLGKHFKKFTFSF